VSPAGLGRSAAEPHAWGGPPPACPTDDLAGPDHGPAARASGLPYLKGGICEVGGGLTLLAEADIYTALPNSWGLSLKEAMRVSPLRRHLAGLSMVGEDLPQEANRAHHDPALPH